MATIIKGSWAEKEAEVRAAQSAPFVFINSNGSKWRGEQPDDIGLLLVTLNHYSLDPAFEKFGNFITLDPCVGVANPKFNHGDGNSEPQWIDGQRIFEAEGVAYFHGNFYALSRVFSIYTNDAETIQKLTDAIRANQQSGDYLAAKVGRAA